MIMTLLIFLHSFEFLLKWQKLKNMTFVCQNIDYAFLRYIVEILLLNI